MGEPLVPALLLATLAGLSIPLGAWLGAKRNLVPSWMEEEFRHSVVAMGGGALFSAVSFALVPEGAERLNGLLAVICFGAGGIVFYFVERWLSARGGHASQFMAMMLDYVPEAAALGALMTGERDMAILMAVIIAMQNLPEAFNAYREIEESRQISRGRQLLFFAAVVPLGPFAAYLGVSVLVELDALLGGIMLFAAGGIVYLLFQDVAPNVRLEQHWGPPLGAVAGYLIGFAGYLMAGG